jgi:hypothetical protein
MECCCYTVIAVAIAALVNAVADDVIAVHGVVIVADEAIAVPVVVTVAVVFAVADDIAVPAITAVAFVANTITDPLSSSSSFEALQPV